jgi:hypothetical protein
MAKTLAPKPKAATSTRGFELTVDPGSQQADGTYTVTIWQTNGRPDNRREITRIPADRLAAAQPALADALRTSGHHRTALTATRKKPIALTEDAGVRAALAAATITGITKPGRTPRLLDGIARLSTEECFYWYAHTLGTSDPAQGRRRLKALRIFLADE